MKKFALYIMSYKGFKVLEHLVQANNSYLIDYVVYGEDKSVQNDYSKEIISLCESNDITFFNRTTKTDLPQSDYSIAISWRWIIDLEINPNLIVLHDSLLPKYRGFAPLVSSLLNEDTKIGVTSLLAAKEYDKGDIIGQESIAIKYPIKIETAIENIVTCYINLVANIFDTVKQNKKLTLTQQNEILATYSLWRDEEDYKIDWSKDATYIQRFVNAVGYPYKGAYTMYENSKIRILDVRVIPDVKIENRTPGKLIFYSKDKPAFVCGKGLIVVEKAVYDRSEESVLPLKKFRVRLG